MKYNKKIGAAKRILWCWETICYGLFIGYILRLFLTNRNDLWVLLLCAPTSMYMLIFGEYIYSDKIKWKNFKWYEWILPLIIFICLGFYGAIKNYAVFITIIGILITYVLTIFVAVTVN